VTPARWNDPSFGADAVDAGWPRDRAGCRGLDEALDCAAAVPTGGGGGIVTPRVISAKGRTVSSQIVGAMPAPIGTSLMSGANPSISTRKVHMPSAGMLMRYDPSEAVDAVSR
jgi:hypothetical protein